MTQEDLYEMFRQSHPLFFNDFDEIKETTVTKSPDLEALNFLNQYRNGYYLIASVATGRYAYRRGVDSALRLNVDFEKMAATITEQEVDFLVRCGVYIAKDKWYYNVFLEV